MEFSLLITKRFYIRMSPYFVLCVFKLLALQLQCPWDKEESLQKVLVLHEYREKTPRELTVKKGDVLILISAYNKVFKFVWMLFV